MDRLKTKMTKLDTAEPETLPFLFKTCHLDQNPETNAAHKNSAIIHLIIYTCAVPHAYVSWKGPFKIHSVYWNTTRLCCGSSVSGHLSSWVAVVVLVLVPQSKLLWECLLDQLIGHLLTHTLDKDSRTESLCQRHKQLTGQTFTALKKSTFLEIDKLKVATEAHWWAVAVLQVGSGRSFTIKKIK